jgi:DNA modification methylase
MQEAGLQVRHVLMWLKNSPTFSVGRLDYDYQHEPILLTWLKKHKRKMRGAFKTSVWPVDRPQRSKHHPTMKPVALYVNAYENHTDRGDVVADTFSGSGTAFIAAEQTKRICYGMDIDPGYVAVTLERYAEYSGKKPRKVQG